MSNSTCKKVIVKKLNAEDRIKDLKEVLLSCLMYILA